MLYAIAMGQITCSTDKNIKCGPRSFVSAFYVFIIKVSTVTVDTCSEGNDVRVTMFQGASGVNETDNTIKPYAKSHLYRLRTLVSNIRVFSYILDHNIGKKCRLIFLISTILSIYCSYLEKAYVKLYQLELMLKNSHSEYWPIAPPCECFLIAE